MPNYKLLSIDESGKASHKHLSRLFVLCGIVIPEKFKIKLDNNVRKLKKRLFGNEEIILHGRDIARKKGPFSVLQDHNKELEFWSIFISLVNDNKINLLFTVVNKLNARKMAWNTGTILKRSYRQMLELFVLNKLGPQTKGKIIVESDPSQDIFLIKAHSSLQCQGIKDMISAHDYKQAITSLSLVGKGNLDVDVQIADTLALLAVLKYNLLDGFWKKSNLSRVDTIKMRFLERKITSKSDPSFFEVVI